MMYTKRGEKMFKVQSKYSFKTYIVYEVILFDTVPHFLIFDDMFGWLTPVAFDFIPLNEKENKYKI